MQHDAWVLDTHRHGIHTHDHREHPGKLSGERHTESGRGQVPAPTEALSQIEGHDKQGFGIKRQT